MTGWEPFLGFPAGFFMALFCGAPKLSLSNPHAYRKEDPPVTIQQARLAAVSAPVYTLPVRR